MSLGPTQAHERIDELGLLDASRNPGTYALQVAAPDGVEAVQRQYLTAKGHPLDDGMAERLAACDTVLYVGRSGDVYDRIMDHVDGEVRRASLLEAFDPVDVRGVWPDDDNTDVAERRRAQALAGPATAVWSDGTVF
ncbi:GIY-YIG endonuclease [Halorubrum tailed virus 28]|uniref:GIY-YIG endonuclease n=1 Tax=Halorubrum tailed virus 28 TaxID=2878009 RepID=A0AAE8Y0Y3_9CAUD|nr:GIY-YIG endonuclease [Halorubrum tailed virus 28]UBF23496.1 GIY-YIG endonuclease [Halorubrum tailed virus 28]